MGTALFLEREHQLDALTRYCAEAGAGTGRLVLVSGEAGVGKSSLVEELAARTADRAWWWGACDGMFTPRALGPFFDIADQAGAELATLSRAGAGRDALFAALMRTLERAGPTVVVVEDVHWADEATLDLLRFLGRRIRRTRTLVLVTYRDDSLDTSHPLRVALGDLATQRSTRRVTLGPLSPAAVAVLAQGSGREPDELHRLTGGSPFFLREVLDSSGPGVPASARDAILARAAGLGTEARRALDCASLLGTRFETWLVREAAALEAGVLDDLLDAGIVVPDGQALRFRHEIARQAVEAQIPPHRATALHGRILTALLDHGCADAARLAFHAEGARDDERVLVHAPQAAREATALASHQEAAAQYERALRHAAQAAPAMRAGLLDALSEELACIDRWPAASTNRQAAIAIWREVGDQLREGESQARLGAVMWRLCRGGDSVDAFARARDLLEPLGQTPELARLLVSGAESTDLDEIARHVRRGHEMAVALGRPDLVVNALNGEAYVAFNRLEDYESPLVKALETALAEGLPVQVGTTYANLTEYLVADLRFAEARPYIEAGIPYCDDHDVAVYGNCVRGHHALSLLEVGRWDEALVVTHEVLSSQASPINRLTSLVTAGLVAARQGRPDAARLLAEADAAARGTDEVVWMTMAGLARTEECWLAGDAVAARGLIADLRARLRPSDRREASAVCLWEHRLGLPVGNDPEHAIHALEVAGPPSEAAAGWDALSMPYQAALALAGSPDEADLRGAVDRLDLLGAVAAARLVRQRMRQLGFRSVPAGLRSATRQDPQGLTVREREVAELLAEGLSNEQIGARLVISPRTVEHHVSAVLAKLGVASRRELARAH